MFNENIDSTNLTTPSLVEDFSKNPFVKKSPSLATPPITGASFPTNPFLKTNEYPDVTQHVEDFKHQMFRNLSNTNHIQGQGEALNRLTNGFSSGGEFDTSRPKYPNLPGYTQNGEPELGQYKGNIVTGDLLNHHLFGQGLGAIEADPTKQAVAVPDSFHNPGTVQEGFNSYLGTSQALGKNSEQHPLSVLWNHMDTIPHDIGGYSLSYPATNGEIYGNSRLTYVPPIPSDWVSLGDVPTEFQNAPMNNQDIPHDQLAALLYTDMKNGKTTFYPGPERPNWPTMTVPSQNKVDSRSQKGANDPFRSGDTEWRPSIPNHVPECSSHGHMIDAHNCYGPNGAYIHVDPARGRDFHGGGSGLGAHSQDPMQPLLPTYGCTRGHNADVQKLGKYINDFKNETHAKVPYIRSRNPKDAEIELKRQYNNKK